LELTWYAAPHWIRPDGPVPLAAFDDPCALRSRALETLAEHGLATEISAEATHLAGVQAAVGAGQGVALMATLGQTPEGLAPRDDLPKPRPLPLAVWARKGLSVEIIHAAAMAMTDLLKGQVTATVTALVQPVVLLQGA
jgi:DNA-binding transcriptional LysR family regulator